MHHNAVVRFICLALGAALLTPGCTEDGRDPASAQEAARWECDLPQGNPIEETSSDVPGFEVQGTGDETWALLWEQPPWRINEEVKVVWRMTGTGDFSVEAVGPDGDTVAPTQGPTPHAGSNWDRPGEEWGTFFRLPTEGCWTLKARRGASVSDIPVMVVP